MVWNAYACLSALVAKALGANSRETRSVPAARRLRVGAFVPPLPPSRVLSIGCCYCGCGLCATDMRGGVDVAKCEIGGEGVAAEGCDDVESSYSCDQLSLRDQLLSLFTTFQCLREPVI